VEAATGFIYLVSLEGVTGSKLTNPNTTFKLIKDAKAQTHPPVMVGFGISKGEHAKAIIDRSRRRSGWKRLCKNIRQKLTKPHCNTT
jgi:tryptophan synthase alpha subunit